MKNKIPIFNTAAFSLIKFSFDGDFQNICPIFRNISLIFSHHIFPSFSFFLYLILSQPPSFFLSSVTFFFFLFPFTTASTFSSFHRFLFLYLSANTFPFPPPSSSCTLGCIAPNALSKSCVVDTAVLLIDILSDCPSFPNA